MREIEFRAKYIWDGSFVYGYLGYKANDGKYIINNGKEINYFVDPETVGQYTGLKDKNGTKIFEGDIVEVLITESDPEGYSPLLLDKFNGEVFFDTLTSKFQIVRKTYIEDDNSYEYEQFDLFDVGIEVIGNIYDNPELLEVK